MVTSIKVIHGPNDGIFNLPDDTSGLRLRRNLAEAFNIPMNAVAFVNGEQVSHSYRLQKQNTLEFVVPTGCKGTGSLAEFMSVVEKHFPLEEWNEEKTLLKQSLFLDSGSYQQVPLFELPSAEPNSFSTNFLVSPNGSFAYQNRVLPRGRPLDLHGLKNGMVVFNGDVVIPTLIDMKTDSRFGSPFKESTTPAVRTKWGAVWMSLTPSEMLTQRPGVIKAQGTVLIGGLGLGWLLKKVCEKDSVERVIVVERSQELLDWYGYELCKRYAKVSEVICDDVYNQIGKHGESTTHLLDIWLLFTDSSRDPKLQAVRRTMKNQLWAWGEMK
jgi:hypothetical protein